MRRRCLHDRENIAQGHRLKREWKGGCAPGGIGKEWIIFQLKITSVRVLGGVLKIEHVAMTPLLHDTIGKRDR